MSGLHEVPADVARQLHDLAVWYASAVDRRDPATLATIFCSDATLQVHRADSAGRAEYHGADEIARIAGRMTQYPRTFHFLGQAAYAEGESDEEATGEVYCIAHHVRPAHPPEDLVMYIRYYDQYRVQGGAWRIARREVNVDFETTHPRVSSVTPAGLVQR